MCQFLAIIPATYFFPKKNKLGLYLPKYMVFDSDIDRKRKGSFENNLRV